MVFTPEKLREVRKAFIISITLIFIALMFFCLFQLWQDMQREISFLLIVYAATLSVIALFGIPLIALVAPQFGIPIYILCFAYLYVSIRFLPAKILAMLLIPGIILTYCGLSVVAMREMAGV